MGQHVRPGSKARAKRHDEAEARNAKTPIERTRAYRLRLLSQPKDSTE